MQVERCVSQFPRKILAVCVGVLPVLEGPFAGWVRHRLLRGGVWAVRGSFGWRVPHPLEAFGLWGCVNCCAVVEPGTGRWYVAGEACHWK